MEMTNKLRERFCKEMNIGIKIHVEPYFSERMELYSKFNNTEDKWKMFMEMLKDFKNDQEYFSYYNKVKDDMIQYLNGKEAMQRFSKDEDFKKWEIMNNNITSNDIFKETLDGKTLISIDMRKANFTCLKKYDPEIVGNKETYEEFVGMFTDYEYLKQSKYLRQVIFGNINPKRQVAYEKRLMDGMLTELLKYVDRDKVVHFSNDEVVIDITDLDKDVVEEQVRLVLKDQSKEGVNLRQETFVLRKLHGTGIYVKKFTSKEEIEFKCLEAYLAPFVYRAYLGEEVRESDMMFMYEHRLAKLVDVPEITVV